MKDLPSPELRCDCSGEMFRQSYSYSSTRVKKDRGDGRVTSRNPLCKFHQERYGRFLSAYFGYSSEERVVHLREAAQLSMIGVNLGNASRHRPDGDIFTGRQRLRHSVLAVEGDAFFYKIVQKAVKDTNKHGNAPIDDPLCWPNARCIALHYGLPGNSSVDQNAFPRATLLAIVASTIIKSGDTVRLCLRSYHRCLDEAAWYERTFGRRHIDEVNPTKSVSDGEKWFPRWPTGLPFYHGIGRKHAGAEPVGGFPFTLLDMKETPELGEGQYGLFAVHPIPYGTCFLYCGPAVSTEALEARNNVGEACNGIYSSSLPNSHKESGHGLRSTAHNNEYASATSHELPLNDATYALGLGQHVVCFGQGLMRYANHRYNLSKFGNVELCSLMLMIPSELSPLKEASKKLSKGTEDAHCKVKITKRFRSCVKKRRPSLHRERVNKCGKANRGTTLMGRATLLEKESHLVTIPFFIATADIEPGEQLLTWSYGEEYDAQLERRAVCDGHLVPYAAAALLDSRQPVGRWQPYRGDYRHGIAAGDIVWCSQLSSKGGRDPLDSLFVVVKMTPVGVGYMLLRPITRSKNQESLLTHFFGAFDGEEWVVFGVCDADVLELCLVAHADTVGLLIADEDYRSFVVKDHDMALRNRDEACECGGGKRCSLRFAVVHATALREATSLVVEGFDMSKVGMPLLRGVVWPLLNSEG